MTPAQEQLSTYHPPIPTYASKQAIATFAENLRAQTKLTSGFELVDLVQRNNGRIEFIDFFDADQTDAIVVHPDDSFVIRLSSYTNSLRNHFTIAHEIGHFLLHRQKVKQLHPDSGMKATRSVDETNQDLVRCEWEANWFASAFLMPEAEFKIAHSHGNASEKFGVSDAAVRVRAKSLGILDRG